MSAIDRIMAAQTFDKGSYLSLCRGTLPAKDGQLGDDVVNGEYTLTIDKIVYKANSNTAGEMIAVEFTVVSSNTEKHPAGSKRSWVQKLAQAHGVSAYKSFLYAALGAKTDEDRAKADKVLPKILAAIEQNQPHPLIGRAVACSVQPHKKKDGTWVTINRYSAGQSQD
jgi:hypothetical protein